MLREPRPGAWTVTCERCPAVAPLTATTLDEARTAAASLGWMDMARRGVGVARWKWLCPSCRPSPGSVMGGATR